MGDDGDLLADDDAHPIPQVATCDVKGIKKTGGAELVIVIASPLPADARSKQRLIEKIKNYLGFIRSNAFVEEAGPPSISKTTIVVDIHRKSDPEIFDLLDRCRDWVLDNHASLVVRER